VGLATLAKREILRFLVVAQQTVFPPLVSSALFLCIFGLSIGGELEAASGGMPYITYIVPGLLTMYLISASFENTSSSLFIARWHNHIQEVLLSPLSYFEMVLGLLVGGVARGVIVASGVYLIASGLAGGVPIEHPVLLALFMLAITVIFSCGGMMAALWAKDFGMLSIWSIYLITPAVFLGGVFNPVGLLPGPLQAVARFNPMTYLVSGVRTSVLGIEEAPVAASLAVAVGLAVLAFGWTVHLFRIGYRLRT
jgi:ABC-2 type transport system permease protein